jgi:hypothetical protein
MAVSGSKTIHKEMIWDEKGAQISLKSSHHRGGLGET